MASHDQDDSSETVSDPDTETRGTANKPEDEEPVVSLSNVKTNEVTNSSNNFNMTADNEEEEDEDPEKEQEKKVNDDDDRNKNQKASSGKKRKRSQKEEEDEDESQADDHDEKPAIKKRRRGRKKKEDEFKVEDILGWRYLNGYCVYRVKWKGFDLDAATWEPIEQLAENEKFHEFVRKVQLQLVEHDESGLIDAISKYDPQKLKEHFIEKYWHGDNMDKVALQYIFKFTPEQDPLLKLT